MTELLTEDGKNKKVILLEELLFLYSNFIERT